MTLSTNRLPPVFKVLRLNDLTTFTAYERDQVIRDTNDDFFVVESTTDGTFANTVLKPLFDVCPEPRMETTDATLEPGVIHNFSDATVNQVLPTVVDVDKVIQLSMDWSIRANSTATITTDGTELLTGLFPRTGREVVTLFPDANGDAGAAAGWIILSTAVESNVPVFDAGGTLLGFGLLADPGGGVQVTSLDGSTTFWLYATDPGGGVAFDDLAGNTIGFLEAP